MLSILSRNISRIPSVYTLPIQRTPLGKTNINVPISDIYLPSRCIRNLDLIEVYDIKILKTTIKSKLHLEDSIQMLSIKNIDVFTRTNPESVLSVRTEYPSSESILDPSAYTYLSLREPLWKNEYV
ncbi:hypothetical protein NPIL_365221 [Nephila pilipes]|uniref:Uncharacterized protein n=1 Tax=Nephila pilipes TaxID=299642 RepID=A0A8X6QY55_NEPPI|nr:hypothetical protein NPIL_365221 [Nephila pilipes]